MNPLLLTSASDRPLLRMDLTPSLATEARDLFFDAARDFEQGIEDVLNFDAGYQLQNDECFQIPDFIISEDVLAACRQPLSAERLKAADLGQVPIKSIVGYDFSQGHRRLYLQNFDSRRILVPGKRFAVFAMEDASTFKELEQPVVLLEARLAAIWDDGVLKFKSFHLANQIFDLSLYFTEATNEQLGQFADHQQLACDDRAKFVDVCSQWSRKKIAMILRGQILDQHTAAWIRDAAQAMNYELPMSGERIALPCDKGQLKALLQFLDEDIYRGPISQRRLLSSGKRELR